MTKAAVSAMLLAAPLLAGPAGDGAPAAAEGLHAGPMLAWVDVREAAVWVQASRPAAVALRYFPEGAPERARLTESRLTTDAADHIATFVLSGLDQGTRYAYELYLDGRLVPRPYPLGFRTQSLWKDRTDPPSFSALVGSCAYRVDPPYDRPTKKPAGDAHVFEAMAVKQPDLMLWLGDNVYTREGDGTPRGVRARYRRDRATPELQRLLATSANYAIWDDNDYGPAEADASYAQKDSSLETFSLYWPAVRYGTVEAPGVFQRFSWADVDFFLLDDRYYRKPLQWPDGPGKTMLGRAQLEWLEAGLLTSKGAFKVIALGNQVLNPLCRFEALARYPADLEELLGFIRDRRIEGVLFLSGDRHHSELLRVRREGLYPLYDFTSSPMTAEVKTVGPDDPERANPDRVPGTLVEEHSFGLLRFEGSSAERRVRLQAFDDQGALRWEHVVGIQELSFGKDR